MAFRTLGALAFISVSSVSAFRNTSPFFLFSTDNLAESFGNTHPQLVTSNSINAQVLESLKDCPSATYFIVHQDQVSSGDYSDGRSTPYLSRWLGGVDKSIASSIIVPEVLGSVDEVAIRDYLKRRCGAESVSVAGTSTFPISVHFPALTSEDRASTLAEHEDSFLESVVSSNLGDEKYTVIYVTTPQDEEQSTPSYQAQQTYEMDDVDDLFPTAMHTELKRDIESHAKDTESEGGLFEKYQFLSPGIFMGLTASLPLLLILYVGIRAVSSLEVSYFAFSKEMGPAGQKKQ
ncbi:BIG1-domain-containing protein [Glonium stellatum]|uniref:Protein BIG1 n=1 Tax=Glonium stellatum TaxID=574774 RepID=A0A8E2JZC3_9PEZI|nr:BIG1-domain-containing protein [Glonium stellatum]